MRRQLPVHSPLPLGALVRSVGPGRASTRRLAERLATTFEADAESVLLTDTGTQALGLALRLAMAHRPGGSVAVPAYTCWDVGTAAQWAGAEVAWYDVDPDDLTPDRTTLEAAMEGAAAAVVSPLFGYPVDWDELARLCHAHGSILVEDAAQGHGSRWRDRPVGSFGDLTILSFGRGKGWTGAGGGALLVRTGASLGPLLDEIARPGPSATVPWLAGALGQALFARPAVYGMPAALPGVRLGTTTYRQPRPPLAMRSATAALVLATERSAKKEAKTRRRTAETLLERLPSGPRVRVLRPSAPGAGFLRLPARLAAADATWERRVQRLGVERGYPLALPDVEELGSLGPPEPPPLPGARTLARELFTVPTHSLLRERDLERITAELYGP